MTTINTKEQAENVTTIVFLQEGVKHAQVHVVLPALPSPGVQHQLREGGESAHIFKFSRGGGGHNLLFFYADFLPLHAADAVPELIDIAGEPLTTHHPWLPWHAEPMKVQLLPPILNVSAFDLGVDVMGVDPQAGDC